MRRHNCNNHVHEENESVSYVVQGKLEVQIGEATVIIEPGDSFYVLSKNTLHRAHTLETTVTIDVFTPIRKELL